MKKSLLILSFFILTSCGFYLKGLGEKAINIELYLKNLDSENPTFEILKQNLQNSGIRLLDNEIAGNLVLVVSNFYSNSRKSATGSSSGDSQEVEFYNGYKVELLKDGEVLAKSNMDARGYVQYKAKQFMGHETEAANVKQQLAEENADATVRFINSVLKKYQK